MTSNKLKALLEFKPKDFVVYQVLPEKGDRVFLSAIEGNKFVQQDAWIGY